MTIKRLAVGLLFFLVLTGCLAITGPTATLTPAPASATPTIIPSSTPAATVTPTTQDADGGAIGPGDVPALRSAALKLEEVEAQGGYVERALWPQPDMAYLRSANTLFPVTVPAPGIDDPPTLGEPFEIGAPGSLLDFAADGSAVAAQGEDGTLALYDLQGSRLTPLDFPTPYFVNFSPNGEWLAVGSQTEREVHVFRTADGEETAVLRGFESAAPVYAAALSPDGQTLLWWARATIQVQDVASGVMGPHFQYQDFVSVFTVSADSRTLAVAVMESIYVYDLSTGMEIDRITLSRPARSLAFSPDGRLLAAGLGPGVQLFDTATWAPLPALGGEGAAINLVSFAPDGRAILAVDEAYQVRVWWK